MFNSVSDMPVAEGRMPDDFSRATSIGDIASPEFLQQAQKFQSAVITFLKEQKTRYESAREKTQFTARYALNERRSRLSLQQTYDEFGRLVESQDDGHVKTGVMTGLTAEAVKMAAALLYKNLYEAYKRPGKIEGKGNLYENDTLVRMAECIIDDMLQRGRFGTRIKYSTEVVPRWGTVPLRYEMGQAADFSRVSDVDGAEVFQEQNVRFCPDIQVWDIKNVLVSNPESPEPEDQEGIFWLSPGKTIFDLEQNEVIFIEDSQRYAGKWRNLQQVRDAEAKSVYNTVIGYNSASFAPQYDLVEYEGRLPISMWVRQGIATYSLLKFFGVNVGNDPGENPDALRNWANRLSRIPVWSVAYLAGSDGRNVVEDSLLRFQPAPGRVPRKTLYKLGFSTDGMNFYCHSVNDLGRQVEDALDTLFNAELWATDYNANPAKAVDASGLVGGNVDDVAKLLSEPGSVVLTRPNTKPDDIVKFFQLPLVQNFEQKFGLIKERFESLTGVTSAIKGMASAKTLGQDQMNFSQSSILFNKTILHCAQSIAKLLSDILDDTHFYMTLPKATPDGQVITERDKVFVDYVTRISGLPASQIKRVEISKDGLGADLIIRHPTMAGEDNSVNVQFLIQLWTATGGMGFTDPMSFVRVCMEMQGIRDAENITKKDLGMDPLDEERLMAQGRWVAPSVDENYIAHLQQHMATLAQINTYAQLDEDMQNLAFALPLHIEETKALLQSAIEMVQLKNQMNPQPMAQAPAGQEGGAGSKEGKSVPQTKEGIQSDIEGNANPQPPAPPAMIPGAV